jgi:Cu(I)/Ag(I) efflux system membrane fusion protein
MKISILKAPALLGLFCILLAACGGSGSADGGREAKFHCPMHPTYVSDRPGDCPICGMRLVPIKAGEAGATGSEARPQAEAVTGRAAVMISPEKRQTIGLTTVVVEERPFHQVIRATGVVRHDETRLARIAPRFGGWVRKLQVNFAGQPVEQGQPLFTAYSPEVFTAQNEFLLALRHTRALSNSPAAERESAAGLLESARRRLELLEIGPEEVHLLEQRGKPDESLQIRSPVTGHVISRNAVEGKAFMAGESLYEIGDLRHLWLMASVPEQELSLVLEGQSASIRFAARQGELLEARVSFVSPHIDPQTRRGEVRFDVLNEQLRLRPDMWAAVEIQVDAGKALAVPASAIIDTGTRVMAFVDREDHHLEPREIQLGVRGDDYVQVISGLKPGEHVVSRALFLVDSESQLKAAIAGMTGGAAAEAARETNPAASTAGHNH